MTRYLYLMITAFGFIRLVDWWAYDSRSDLDLLQAIIFLTMGAVYWLETHQQRALSLLMRYAVGLLTLLIASIYASAWLIWGAGALIIITAILDTIPLHAAATTD